MAKDRQRALLTKKNWVKKLQDEKDLDGETPLLLGYLICAERSIPVLEKIIKKAEDFEKLKAEVLKHIEKQKDFVADVNEKINSHDPSDYGLTL